MGNDSSRLKGLVIDKNTVEANDFWALYNAEMPTSNDDGKQLLSIFQGEPVVTGQLWVTQGPMERAIKNLMIYRHPYILKYVARWEQGGQKHLATERVRPLIVEVTTLSDIQVCLGLRTILCSLIFLIEKAQARHLNICISSINIADDGSWRLAGFEYVWKSKEVTKKLLDLANAYRYKPAIDPHEMKDNNTDCIEQFAFATLCEEIFVKCSTSGGADHTATPYVREFHDYCATHLKHKNAQMRPQLSAVLLHPYFNHEFVLIHSFLIELPLKSVPQKQDFFTGLIDRLRCFNEDVVGAQLAELLLSRMVLLDPTAQLCVTPYVLKTKSDYSAALFSNQTYARYLLPHIRRNFRLRDAQIRLILLEYFMEFVRLLTLEELQDFILPHLQAGMRDTNDILVAKTLRCLADLVPILGSALVVGGERARLFSDGRPQAALSADSTCQWVEPRSITPVMGGNGGSEYMVSGSPLPEIIDDLGSSFNSLPQTAEHRISNSEQNEMPPRLSPDGGEDDEKMSSVADGLVQSAQQNETTEDNLSAAHKLNGAAMQKETYVKQDNDEEEEAWSDWETDELQRLNGYDRQVEIQVDGSSSTSYGDATRNVPVNIGSSSYSTPPLPPQASVCDSLKTNQALQKSTTNNTSTSTKIIDDLNSLDIIVQKTATPFADHADEFDFFKDMEPVIETKRRISIVDLTSVGAISSSISNSSPLSNKNTFTVENPTQIEEEIQIDTSRFAAVVSNEANELAVAEAGDGWCVDDDDVDWNAA